MLAVVTFFYLTDRPADADWLGNDQRQWLKRRLDAEDARREHVSPASVLASLYDYRVLALSLVYFGAVACLYGVGFWLPTIVKGFGVSIAMTGWITAIPYVVGFFGMVWWGLRSDLEGRAHDASGDRACLRGDRRRRLRVSGRTRRSRCLR